MRQSRRGTVQALSNVLGRQLDGMQITRKIREHTAPLIWNEVVGEQIARSTEVLGIDGGVLRVSARSAVWASELTFYKADILRRLNARLSAGPEPVVLDIQFVNRGLRARPADPPPPALTDRALDAIELSERELRQIDAALDQITDATLRARMRQARLSEARLRTWRLDNGWAPCPFCGELAPMAQDEGGCQAGAWRVSCARCRIAGASR